MANLIREMSPKFGGRSADRWLGVNVVSSVCTVCVCTPCAIVCEITGTWTPIISLMRTDEWSTFVALFLLDEATRVCLRISAWGGS
jgi:hypothetical protein